MYNENISDILPLSRDVCVYYELVETEVLNDFEKQNIISASAAALGMEQGASASEIADKITDPELKEWFRKLDEASFNAYAKADTMLSENVRKKLMK